MKNSSSKTQPTLLFAILTIMLFLSPLLMKAQRKHIILYGDPQFMQLVPISYGLITFELKDSLQDGKWFVVSETSQRKAILHEEKDVVMMEVEYCRGARNGSYISYHTSYDHNRRPIKYCEIRHYINGKLNGIYEYWRETELISSGYYTDGLRTGEWHEKDNKTREMISYMYSHDSLIAKKSYKDNSLRTSWDLKENMYKEFDPQGNIISTTLFTIEGPYTKQYSQSGKLIAEGRGQFTDSDILKFYNMDGWSNVVFWRKKMGPWKFYDEQGKLIKEE